MSESAHSLVLAFDTDDAIFARGFEVGVLWAELRAQPDRELEATVHTSNAEMVLRISESLGRRVFSTGDDGTWMTVTFSETMESDAEPSPGLGT